ncbi:5-formyltetrahydrofolate cyclo-ligase [Arthrobacter bambusae]|uniref:5-formyltetrahydrofolate cyclo-ligase n=1 Tax=Arthrobacter bambusae TaxID=1338426 RepID=UPI0027826FE5|nr:5-formyltetrahydrofolate cyclo-ligase [Arthrobacter bambusae]MDQ0211894.1 5-formyltetrahydrofolate cyclo-ligase [Arthrobacter bambusae]MDQ0236460.1 5-formyltetrahydrofolate cyclo-ligase [Arthrobacter bambusae]
MTLKDDIRRDHRKRRLSLTGQQRAEAGAGIARRGVSWAADVAHGRPATFAAYLGVAAEPPTMPLLDALHAAGHRIILPVCEPERRLSWVYWTPETAFVRSKYAPIDEPVGERFDSDVIKDATGIFLPATAVDEGGNRIGQGGGYYDRLLDKLDADGNRPPTVAVVYDHEVLPAGTIPAEPFDKPVAEALTPHRIVQLVRPA